jgi:hypothetical protein
LGAGDCNPLAGHLEKSLAQLWVSGQVREVYALARKVFHFTVGCHDAPPAPVGKAAPLVAMDGQARCEWLVCPDGDSMENTPTAPPLDGGPFVATRRCQTYQLDFTPGKNCLPPGTPGRDLAAHRECIGEAVAAFV